MRSRSQVLMSLALVFLILGAAWATWSWRTGRLTIFGDAEETLNADLSVTDTLDLAKGASAGDGNLVVDNGTLVLSGASRSGTAQFTVGQREVVALHRIVPEIDEPYSGASAISFSVAGSPDGISFNQFSPPQPVVVDIVGGLQKVRPIELGFLVPEGSRFVRVRLTLERPPSGELPGVHGFTLNYSQRASLTSDDSLTVNGSPANQSVATPIPKPGRPATLVVTGPGSWLWLLLAAGVTGSLGVLARRKEGNGRGTPPQT